MREVKVLGTGCANCRSDRRAGRGRRPRAGHRDHLEKVEALPEIARYGVMATPGVVVDGKVVHAGGVPRREKIAEWLAADAAAKPAGGCGCKCSCG